MSVSDLCPFVYFTITPLLTPCSALFCHLISACTDLSSCPHSTELQVTYCWLTIWLITRLHWLTLDSLCCLVPVYAMLPLLAICSQLGLSCPVFPCNKFICVLVPMWRRLDVSTEREAPPPFLVHSSDDRKTDNSVASVSFYERGTFLF